MNVISFIISEFDLDRNEICNDLNISIDHLNYIESPSFVLSDSLASYFALKCFQKIIVSNDHERAK